MPSRNFRPVAAWFSCAHLPATSAPRRNRGRRGSVEQDACNPLPHGETPITLGRGHDIHLRLEFWTAGSGSPPLEREGRCSGLPDAIGAAERITIRPLHGTAAPGAGP